MQVKFPSPGKKKSFVFRHVKNGAFAVRPSAVASSPSTDDAGVTETKKFRSQVHVKYLFMARSDVRESAMRRSVLRRVVKVERKCARDEWIHIYDPAAGAPLYL